jgi:hypothetical protein
MTVSTTTRKKSYTANGSSTVFAYDFRIFSDSDLKVYVDGSLKTLTTHFTVSGAGEASGGNVTFGSAPADTLSVVILRELPRTQTTDYVDNSALSATSLEDTADKNLMLIQEIDSKAGEGFRFADVVVDAGVTTVDKNASDRASKLLSFDSAGDLIATQEIGVSRGNWAASTAYNQRDIIKDTDNNNIYLCITAHTSSGAVPISTNADVAKWVLLVDAASATTSQTAAASSATSAASSATSAASSATSSASDATDTAADLVLTNADVVLTNADVVLTNADVVSAEAAKVAAEGATGASAFKFTFDNSTSMADPGTGEIRFDNATVASVTNLAFDAVSADTSNPDVSDFIASWDDGSNTAHEGYITIRKSGTPATYAVFSLTGSVTDSTGWLQCPVTHVDSNGTWSNADTMFISFSRSGDKGNTGTLAVGTVTGNTVTVGNPATAAVANSGSSTAATFDFTFGIPTGATGATGASSSGFHYQFATATADSDQGAGKIWLNHATVASATILYIDDDDNDGTDISAFTATWDDSSATSDKGFIKIQSRATPTDYAVFKISSTGTDNTAYWEFPVSNLVSAGTFSDTEVVDVFFTRSGDSGGVANRTVDTMVGDASDDTLALSQSPGSTNNCTCFIDGVGQHPGTDFNISGSTLTFTTAPPTGTVVVAICGGNENIGTPSDGTVTLAKMSTNSIDSDQYVDGSIDLAHMSAESVDSDQYVDGSIDTIHIGDDQVTGAKLNPALVTGDVIYADGTDTITRLAKPGTPAGEVLTFATSATAPSWVAPSSGSAFTTVAAVATSSGTSPIVIASSLPSGICQFTVNAVSMSAGGGTANNYIIQLGDSGGYEATGYVSGATRIDAGTDNSFSATTGLLLIQNSSSDDSHSQWLFTKHGTGNTWMMHNVGFTNAGSNAITACGVKTLSGELTQIQITQLGTPTTWDAGTIAIQYTVA